jgi:hypothetical protein
VHARGFCSTHYVSAAAAKSGPVPIPRRPVTDDPLDAIVEQEFPVGAALFCTEEFDHVADRLEARVVDLFPPNTRGLTCLFVGAAESHRPMPTADEFTEPVMLEEDRVHALLEPVEKGGGLGPVRGILIGLLIGAGFWLIACLMARPS